MRRHFTGLVKTMLHRCGVIGLARRLGAQDRHLPVVRYHSVSEGADYCPSSITISPAHFERQIAYLAANYHVITLDAAVRHLHEGVAFPTRSIAITFDDGYEDNVTNALPVLQRHGVSAMFYVATGPVLDRASFWVGWLQRAINGAPSPLDIADAVGLGQALRNGSDARARQALIEAISRRINTGPLAVREETLGRIRDALGGAGCCPDGVDFMMDVEGLRKLVMAGMEIGSHTVSHPILTGLPDVEARVELQRSREVLEEALQQPVLHLAYPNGVCDFNFDDRTKALAADAGYRSAVTSERGSFALDSDPLTLPRHGANHMLGMSAFAFKIEEHRFGPLLMR